MMNIRKDDKPFKEESHEQEPKRAMKMVRKQTKTEPYEICQQRVRQTDVSEVGLQIAWRFRESLEMPPLAPSVGDKRLKRP
jgi:hypothetical protein